MYATAYRDIKMANDSKNKEADNTNLARLIGFF